ncbi:hypothetical protein BGZ73_001642 [Actinomortierella ambigua]|nr:hypothetical protein BGZ73_001642 [Actinomortierella ambigua]
MMSFYEDSAERGQQDLYDNKRARVRLESLEKKVVEIAAERDDGAAVFGLSAKEKHELYELQKSASWTVFEAMLWILYRSGFVYRSVRLLTKLYQTTFRPKGNQDEVELLLMSPLFRPFLKVTAHNGSLCFRLDPMRIQATLRASNFGAADIKFPPLLPGVRGDDQFLLETNSESWVYALHPLVRAAMLAKANTGFQPGFPYTGMLLPSAHNFVGELIDLDKRVPLWDALLVVLDLVDTMPAGNWERKHALLEIYISVAKAIVGTFDKIMMDLQDDAATLCRLASARSQSTYHRSLLTAAPSAAGDAVETTDTIPANISVYDDVDDAGSDVTDSNESDLDDPAASPPGLQRSESSEAKPKWHMQDGDKGWNEKGQSRGSEWRDSGDGSRMNEKGRYRDHGSYSEYESQRGNKYNSPYGYAGRNQSCSPERNGRHDVRR